MKATMLINNDRTVPMSLRIVSVTDEPHEGRQVLIKPASIYLAELELPEGTVPYLKIWENGAAFLSYAQATVFDQEKE